MNIPCILWYFIFVFLGIQKFFVDVSSESDEEEQL